MKKEEEKEDRSKRCLHHEGWNQHLTNSHASCICVDQSTAPRCLHAHLYTGIPTSGFKTLGRGIIVIVSHVQLFFVCFGVLFFLSFITNFLGSFFYFCFCFNSTQARVIWKEAPSSEKMPLGNWFGRTRLTMDVPPWAGCSEVYKKAGPQSTGNEPGSHVLLRTLL